MPKRAIFCVSLVKILRTRLNDGSLSWTTDSVRLNKRIFGCKFILPREAYIEEAGTWNDFGAALVLLKIMALI